MTGAAVREVTAFRPEGGVVAGDEGSRGAAVAVRAAAEDALRRGAALYVVRAWSMTSAVRPAGVPVGIVPSMTEFEAATLAEEQSRVEGLIRGSGAAAQVHVVHAGAVKALLTAGESADLLVVARRGRGGFPQLLLGSVADQCVRHARCSVLVVRG